jgi:hypothetical protein
MKTIEDLLQPYSELEASVRQLMSNLFSKTCGMCTACCCRTDICEEATESAFLAKLLAMQGIRASDMDEGIGWLDLHGCTLEYGRPPVCYAYYCDELIARLPDEDARQAAIILGKLMYHVGCNALGEWHLVEVMDQKDLDKVDFAGLSRRLEEAQAAFEVIKQYVDGGRSSTTDLKILAAITTEEP